MFSPLACCAWRISFSGFKITFPFLSSTVLIAIGVISLPPLAITENALAISIGRTEQTPSPIGYPGTKPLDETSSSGIPNNEIALEIAALKPIPSKTLRDGMFIERTNAYHNCTFPSHSPLKF